MEGLSSDTNNNENVNNEQHVSTNFAEGDEVVPDEASTSTRPKRDTRPPTHLDDYIVYSTKTTWLDSNVKVEGIDNKVGLERSMGHASDKSEDRNAPSLKLPRHSNSSGTPYPLVNYVNFDNFLQAHRRFIAAVTSKSEPRSYHEAVQHEDWRNAMAMEIAALEANQTWTLIDLPVLTQW